MAVDLYGTRVGSTIVPFTADDTYATHDEQYGKGGYRTVESIDARNTIPYARRTVGMLVNVENVGIFKLATNPNTDTTTDANWVAFSNMPVNETTDSTGSQISLSDTSYVVTDCDKLKNYLFNVYLTANTSYSKLKWILIVGDQTPTVQFLVTTNGNSVAGSARLIYDDKNTFSVLTHTTHVFEFETYDGGATWLASCKRYSEYAAQGNEYFEVITRKSLNDALSWTELQD